MLVRLLTRDDPGQTRAAARLLPSEDVFVPKTVLQELVWVLEYTYGFERADILGALTKLLGLSTVRVEDAVTRAVDWYARGMDFADALHLASARGAHEFATCDRRLAGRAGAIAATPPVRRLGRGLCRVRPVRGPQAPGGRGPPAPDRFGARQVGEFLV